MPSPEILIIGKTPTFPINRPRIVDAYDSTRSIESPIHSMVFRNVIYPDVDLVERDLSDAQTGSRQRRKPESDKKRLTIGTSSPSTPRPFFAFETRFFPSKRVSFQAVTIEI